MARLRTMNRRRQRSARRELQLRREADFLASFYPYQRAAVGAILKSQGKRWDDVLKLPVRPDPPGSLGAFIVRSSAIRRILHGDGMVSGRTAHNHPNLSYGLRPSDQSTIHRIGLDHIIVDEAEPLVSREILEALPCA